MHRSHSSAVLHSRGAGSGKGSVVLHTVMGPKGAVASDLSQEAGESSSVMVRGSFKLAVPVAGVSSFVLISAKCSKSCGGSCYAVVSRCQMLCTG
jgi:hypothetical protein